MERKKSVLILLLLLLLGASACTAGTTASLRGTAVSRLMDGTIIDWSNHGCSYQFNDGILQVSFEDHTGYSQVPLPDFKPAYEEVRAQDIGIFLSQEKAALVFNNTVNQLSIMISDDEGASWETTYLPTSGDWFHIGFSTEQSGWLIVCRFRVMGAEEHELYRTGDGGLSWEEVDGNIDEVWGRMLSCAGFIDQDLGFLGFRYEDPSFEPAILKTTDGGITWSKLYLEIPEAEQSGDWNATALSPLLDDHNEIVFPVFLSYDGGAQSKIIYYVSKDGGASFSLSEEDEFQI